MGLAAATEAAASAFLDSLDESARASARADFASDARTDWHYIPRQRPGLALADMTVDQHRKALDLLASGVSSGAFGTSCLVMALEDPLDRSEGGGRGRHRGDYSVIVFGTPGDAAWSWRFEGHHVSVTITVVDGEVRATPSFLGANPARLGDVRILPREQDLAFELLGSLSLADRERAVLGGEPPDDILTKAAPSALDVLPTRAGVLFGDLGGSSHTAAAALVAIYLGRLPSGHPSLVTDPAQIRFAFAGEPVDGQPHYYRLLGPDLLVEYDNTQDGANHVHTVVRHPSGDFGDDLLRRHRAESH